MKNVFDLIRESSLKYPQKVFIKSADGAWTYSQVYFRTRVISRRLLDLGVEKGDRVVLFCPNSLQYIAGFFGIMAIGAIAVPINPVKLADSVGYIIEKCSPRFVMYNSVTADKLEKTGGSGSVGRLNIDEIEDIPIYLEWNIEEKGEEDDPALILFTSGTTRQPKGVTLTHKNLISNTLATNEYLHLTNRDSILMTLPFSYSYGNSILLTHAGAGAQMVLENSTAYPALVLESIKRNGVTGFSTVGSYIHLMLKYIESLKEKVNYFESLRYITFAGESTNYDDITLLTDNYPHVRVFIMYGQTEAGPRLSYLEPELVHVKKGSIGRGMSNVELIVVNETGKRVGPGETGEILAYGPNIMKCYWDDPDATLEVVRDGWLHTGDIATVDEEGYIYIRGRKTDMIKFMGHRISPLEIENVINGCPKVKESAVVEGSMNGIPVIKACVILEGECPLDEIRQNIYSRLPSYMRPQIIEITKELPRTDNGKIKRSELRGSACVE